MTAYSMIKQMKLESNQREAEGRYYELKEEKGDAKKKDEILKEFIKNPIKISYIIFDHDKILDRFICPITNRPIRFIVKLTVPGVKLPVDLRYEKTAIKGWLGKNRNSRGRLPGYDQPVDLASVKIINDLYNQGKIDLRLEEIAEKLKAEMGEGDVSG